MGEGWKQARLGDVVTAIRGGGTPDKGNPSYWDGDIPWVSVKDLKGNVLLTTEDSITEAGLSESASNAFDANTIVIATRMAVGATVKLGKRMAINQDLKAILPSGEVTNDYLYRYLQMSAPKLAALGTGSTVKGITLGGLRHLMVSFPESHDEQERITDILLTWDRAIELTSALLDAACTRKRGLMQILLTGKCRFSEFEGQAWREVRLGDIADVSMGSSPKSSGYNTDGIGLALVQGNADIKNGKTVPRLSTSEITTICQVGDILLSVRAPVGTVAISNHKACIGRGAAVIRPTESLGNWVFTAARESD